jgi:hypothetical protein
MRRLLVISVMCLTPLAILMLSVASAGTRAHKHFVSKSGYGTNPRTAAGAPWRNISLVVHRRADLDAVRTVGLGATFGVRAMKLLQGDRNGRGHGGGDGTAPSPPVTTTTTTTTTTGTTTTSSTPPAPPTTTTTTTTPAPPTTTTTTTTTKTTTTTTTPSSPPPPPTTTTTNTPPPPPPSPSGELRGYYDQGANIPGNWSSYSKYGFNSLIADFSSMSFLTGLAAAGNKVWISPDHWNQGSCSFAYSDSQAATWAKQAAATGAVAAFYLADEPSTGGCPNAVATVAARSAVYHQAAPGIPTVIATFDSADLTAFAKAADQFALDYYPCQYGSCNMAGITQLAATADKLGLYYYGVPQAFGGDGHYTLPSASQLKTIIDTWKSTKEHGYFIYAFSAVGEASSNFVQNHPDLMAVIQQENAS